MIADYVNDEVDVVGRAFLGSVHRLRPMPRPQVRPDLRRGLLRAGGHLLQHQPGPRPGARQYAAGARPAAVERRARPVAGAGRRRQASPRGAGAAAPRRGRPRRISPIWDRSSPARLRSISRRRASTGSRATGSGRFDLDELARQRGLHPRLLAGWVDYLGRVADQPTIARHPILCEAAAGRLTGPALARAAEDLERALASLAAAGRPRPPGRPSTRALAMPASCGSGPMIRIRSPIQIPGSPSGRIVRDCPPTPGRRPARSAPSRRPSRSTDGTGPCCDSTAVPCSKCRGRAPGRQPVRRLPDRGFGPIRPSPRRLGGFRRRQARAGPLAESGGRLQAVLRNDGKAGDLADAARPVGVRGRLRSPGARAARRCIATGRPPVRRRASIGLGRPGHRGAPHRRAGLREQPPVPRRPGGAPRLRPRLDDAERKQVEAELQRAWFEAGSGRVPRGSGRRTPRRAPVGPRPVLAVGGRTEEAAARRASGSAGRAGPRAGGAQEEARDGDPPGGRRAGRRPQGDASRGLQGRRGLRAREPQAARQDRAAGLPAHPDGRAPAAGSPRGAAGGNSPTGWRAPTIP